ncbi:MAG TPA: hypothetical protein VMV69_09790 [Pirellulales bacterium]|nr:hypothetical protein [Pirellulales bacterium]
MAAAAEVLGENGPDGAPRQALARGLSWMGRHFSVHANAGLGGQGWLLYYLDSVERVGRLTKEPLIGEHDWYREGAELLLDTQDKLSGSWKGQGHVEDDPHVGTSFARLFLAKGGKEKKRPDRP